MLAVSLSLKKTHNAEIKLYKLLLLSLNMVRLFTERTFGSTVIVFIVDFE